MEQLKGKALNLRIFLFLKRTTDLKEGSVSMAVKIDESKCTGCGICVQACPVEAITVEHVAKIDAETCTGCGACIAECPNEAIFAEGMKPASPLRVNHTPSSHISATRVATSTTLPQDLSSPTVFHQIVRSGGLLNQIFDFFRISAGRGGGRGRGSGGGRGHGGGRGRGKGRQV